VQVRLEIATGAKLHLEARNFSIWCRHSEANGQEKKRLTRKPQIDFASTHTRVIPYCTKSNVYGHADTRAMNLLAKLRRLLL